MLNKLKKNNKKGFTLVELIVVLVILAILAALLIPALTGYIDKAKERQIIAETRQLVMASQTMVDEAYGLATLGTVPTITISSTATSTDLAAGTIAMSDVATLAELNIGTGGATAAVTVTGGLVTGATYSRNGRTCTYAKASATAQATFTMSTP